MNKAVVKPTIFVEGSYTSQDIEDFKKSEKVWRESDIHSLQLAEVFEINNPALLRSPDFKEKLLEYIKENSGDEKGNWVYYPWSGEFVHCVSEADHFALRTNRNKNLITKEEQDLLYSKSILVTGMSVGNIIATGLVYAGFAKDLIIADFDTIETANLNRLRAGVADIGKSKIQFAAEQIYEINPYINLHTYPEGLKKPDLENLTVTPDIIIDEIDDFAMKVELRFFAQKNNIPVVMMTSLGDNVLIDIERYDLDDGAKPFAGIVDQETLQKITQGEVSELEKVKYAIDLVGKEYIPTKALGSLFEIGNSLVGRPQLASTILLDGGMATIVVKSIILREGAATGRYYFDGQKFLGAESKTADTPEREAILTKINERLNK